MKSKVCQITPGPIVLPKPLPCKVGESVLAYFVHPCNVPFHNLILRECTKFLTLHKFNSGEKDLDQFHLWPLTPPMPFNSTYALQLHLCPSTKLSWSIASGERSLSILRGVKNQFRSTMAQEGIVVLYLVASNNDILIRKLEYD